MKKAIKNKYVVAFLNGVKPIVMGLITFTGVTLVLKVLGYVNISTFNFDYIGLITLTILAIIYCVVRYVCKIKFNTIIFILISAFTGLGLSLILI